MPLFQETELEDGRYLGLSVREVTALPHVDVFGTDAGRMGQVFEGLLGDLARLCGESAALELLWLSQPVSGQKFPRGGGAHPEGLLPVRGRAVDGSAGTGGGTAPRSCAAGEGAHELLRPVSLLPL